MPDWLEIIIRTTAAVLILFVLTKLLGKRQISQLSLFEYITGITIGNIAAFVSLDLDEHWALGIIALVVWVVISIGIEYLTIKSRRLSQWMDGTATILIEKGVIHRDRLFKEKLTVDELMEQLRKKDVFRAADVEFAIMEPSGELNVMLKNRYKPVTAEMLGIEVGAKEPPLTVIVDGTFIDEAMRASKYSESEVEKAIVKEGNVLTDILLGQLDAGGRLALHTNAGAQLELDLAISSVKNE